MCRIGWAQTQLGWAERGGNVAGRHLFSAGIRAIELSRTASLVLASVTATGLLATSAALAFTPTAGVWTAHVTGSRSHEGDGAWVVSRQSIGGAVNYGRGLGKLPTAPSTFRCNNSNLLVATKRIAIRNGKFSYVGKAYVDFSRNTRLFGTLTWKGTFTGRGAASGTVRFVSPVTPKGVKKRCDSGKQRWTAQPLP
jgi:hypothetical protein